jgi:hypothetical protein
VGKYRYRFVVTCTSEVVELSLTSYRIPEPAP